MSKTPAAESESPNSNFPPGYVPNDFSNQDLYQLEFPSFTGPLDLLLFLIHREKVDITDIPVSKITRQYLDYLSLMEHLDIEIASEFLSMAAELLEIKAKLLLPKPELSDETVAKIGNGYSSVDVIKDFGTLNER